MSEIANPVRSLESSPARGKRVQAAGLWIVQGVLALAFIAAGTGKLLGRPEMVALYEAIGIGQWFRYATGLLELAGAALILVPKTRVLGAGLLASIMLGAIAMHLLVLHDAPTIPLVLLALASLCLWLRREEVLGLLHREHEA
jgi:uncharacterized membrane protein YphA (DoxX/SURF4 family)